MEEYERRMRENPYFRAFGVRPRWTPGVADVRGFIYDEVVRQGWNPETKEGQLRVRWMTKAWDYAEIQASRSFRPGIGHLLKIAYYVEPYENRNGFRTGNVLVGGVLGTSPRLIRYAITQLWNQIDEVVPEQGRGRGQFTADDFYLEFEKIHPFGDGNGRTGKILHNWLLGTLRDPVLIKDYFGGGNP